MVVLIPALCLKISGCPAPSGKLSKTLEDYGLTILGTDPDAIDRSEDRERFQQIIEKLNLKQPNNKTVSNL